MTFVGTEQLFACPGKNLCEVCLYADDTKDTSLGSLNFFIEVEPDPLAGGLTSETQIHDLYQQVEEITQQVIGDDYYDKTEVDDLLDDKADKSTTYTKTQVDSALALKADTATTYTKTQVDNALALKANTADLATVATTGDYDDLTNKPTIPAAQVQSDWDQSDNTKVDYIKNKPDLSVYVTSDDLGNIIYDLLPAGTASGAVANFETEVGGVPLVDCKANIVATGGNGTPDNPNPINGYTEANIIRNGINLWDEEWEFGAYNPSTGEIKDRNDRIRTKNYIPIKGGVSLYCVTPSGYGVNHINFFYYDANKTFISFVSNATNPKTTPANACYMTFYIDDNYGTTYNNDISINYPSSDTSYHAYTGNTYTIAFGQTVYGCVLDVTRGKLTVTYNYNADMISYNWTYDNTAKCWQAVISGMKSYPSRSADLIAEEWSADTSAVAGDEGKMFTVGGALYCYTADNVNKPTGELVYPLATPFEIDLTPEVISAIVGTNNVYSDTNGDTEVQYKDSIQHYIDSRV